MANPLVSFHPWTWWVGYMCAYVGSAAYPLAVASLRRGCLSGRLPSTAKESAVTDRAQGLVGLARHRPSWEGSYPGVYWAYVPRVLRTALSFVSQRVLQDTTPEVPRVVIPQRAQ